MNQRRELEVSSAAAAGRSKESHETRVDVGTMPWGGLAIDRFAADLALRALAQQLVAVEEWCGCHSEYFLG